MAKQPHHDDDQGKKKPGGKDAQASPTPKPMLPNLSLDDEEPLAIEEVVEAEPVPLAEPIPAGESASDVVMAEPILEPLVLSDDDVLAEEVVEAAPLASDVFLADDVEEVVEVAPASEVVEVEPLAEEAVLADEVVAQTPVETPSAQAKPLSDGDLVLADDVVEVTGSSAVLAEATPAAPASEVDLMQLLSEASATPLAEPLAESIEDTSPTQAEPAAEFAEDAAEFVEAEPEVDLLGMEEEAPVASEMPIEESVAAGIEEAAPASAVKREESLFADEPIAAAPSSEIVTAGEEPVIAAPASEVMATDEPVASAPASEVVSAHEPIEHAPASGVLGAAPLEPIADAAPGSAVVADESLETAAEAMPASGAIFDEEVAEAMPESAVIADEAAPASDIFDEEVAEAMPDSAVVADEAAPASDIFAEEVAEAMPESAVVAEEAVEEAAPTSGVVFDEEVAEAMPESGVVFDEDVAEAMPESAVVAEEAAEGVPGASSATRKSEAVLGDEVEVAESVSGVEEAVEATSGVVFDDLPEGSAVKKKAGKDATKTVDLDQTMAFQPPSSAARKADDEDLLVTEEEVAGTSEASAVDLGDVHAKKGSSVTGIDKVAEALESGVDLGATAPPEPSVEFDEILDDIDEAEEAEEAEPVAKKPGKKAAKGTGDDIDLNDLFGDEDVAEAAEEVDEAEAAEGTEELSAEEAEEAEAAEAFDEEVAEAAEAEEADAFDLDDVAEAAEAEEAEEAEAAEAFDEEVEAAEATEDDELADFGADEKPAKSTTKMGKKTRVHDDEEEEAEAFDEEEEVSPKKKGKKGKKEKAIAAPPAKSGFGCFALVVAMFLPFLLIAGAGAGAWFGANDQVRDLAKTQLDLHEKAPPRVVPPLEKASDALAKRKYAEAIAELKNAKDPEEFNVRGEARWFAYVEVKKDALDKDAPEVKDALSDLDKGSNKVLADQIRLAVELPNREKGLNDQITKLKTEKDTVETDLAKVTKEKEDADKKIDNLADVLAKSKVIEDKTKLDAAVVQKVLQELNTERTTLATVNKLLKDAEVKGAGDEGVKEVIKLRDEADKNLLAVNKVLEDEKIKDKGAKGVLEIVDVRNKTIKDRDDLLKTVGDAFKEFVDGKIVPENADARKTIVEGAKLARQKAESPLSIPLAQLGMSLGGIGSGTSKVVEQTFDLSKVFSELGFFRTREPFIQTPEQKMDTHMALLANRKKNDAKELAAITREADWVLAKESKADEDSRSKARFVQGLALRNQEKFAAAKAAFEETLNRLKPINKAAPWSKAVTQAQREITDPTVYFLPRVDMFRAEQDYKSAFDVANIALKAMPDEARLYAVRGLIRYEAVRGQGSKIPADVQKEIRTDALTAAKDEKVAAESAYIVGLLEEDLQNWPEAEKSFRQALKLHVGAPEDAGKYRIALGRILLRDRGEAGVAAPPPPEDKKDEKKLDKKDDAKDEKKLDKKEDGKLMRAPAAERTIVLHPWSVMIAAVVVAQPVEELDDKETLARVNESIKLAQELIASKNNKLKGQGYLLLGSALSKIGKRTEGLKEYSKGLKLVYPGIETKEIDDLIHEHPAFQQPDISGTPNPVMAERHFGEGMHLYWSKDFEKAEAQFKTAVKYFDRDARYQYYLGLSQLAQKSKLKRDAAYYSFEVGARLEAKSVSTNPYAARDINMSLERIQGPVRELLNGFRFKALDPEADAKAPAPQ